MQRRDLVIVLVGALLVGGTTAYAAVQPGAAAARYDLAYSLLEAAFPMKPTGTGSPAGTFTVASTVSLHALNITRVHVEGHATASVAFAPTATMHATLEMPNGSKLEKDVSAAPGGASMDVAFDVDVATPPANASVSAPNSEAALALALPPSTAGEGSWTLTLAINAFPNSVSGFGVDMRGSTLVWSAAASPVVPAAK